MKRVLLAIIGVLMAIIAGLAPANIIQSPGWNHTFVDRSVALPNGQDVTLVELFSTAARSYVLKILRENSSQNYDVVAWQSYSHPGGGWAGTSVPFAVPATGIYRMGAYTSVSCDASVNGPRSSVPGNPTGTNVGGFTATTARLPPMRVTVGEDLPPIDPPPPPSGETHYVNMTIGQSNGMNFGNNAAAKAAFAETLQTLTGSTRPIVWINKAIGGSAISTWAPGQPNYNAAVSAWNTAIAAPGAIPGAVIWFQGEGDSPNCAAAALWDDSLRVIISSLKTAVQQPTLPVLVTELFVNPAPTTRIYWHLIQRWQREVGAENVFASAADLVGSPGDPIHLAQPELVIMAGRFASALAPRMTP